MAREQSQNELKVIAAIPLLDFYNTQVTVLGSKYKAIRSDKDKGVCPFHADLNPSLGFWKPRNSDYPIFHCFGCGFSGNVIQSYIKLQKDYRNTRVSLEQAIQQLASLFGLELDQEQGFVVQSPLERARAVLLDSSIYHVPRGALTLGEFRDLNTRVATSHYPVKVKIENFDNLDIMAATVLSSK